MLNGVMIVDFFNMYILVDVVIGRDMVIYFGMVI